MVYCMSDIHGEIDRFHDMLQLIKFSDEDQLYILGDVIDRYPSGVDILKEIMEMPNATMLLGNHEQMCLDTLGVHFQYGARQLWQQNGGSCTYREMVYCIPTSEKNSILRFLSKLPVMFDIKVKWRTFRLVHGWPGDEKQDQIWGRPFDYHKWDWSDDVTPIIGHTPTIHLMDDDEAKQLLLRENDDHMRIFHAQHDEEPNKFFIDIDCGCGNKTTKRRLACLRLDDMEEFYV